MTYLGSTPTDGRTSQVDVKNVYIEDQIRSILQPTLTLERKC